VLLLTSALLVSIYSVATPPKQAHAGTLTFGTISSASGVYGDWIFLTFTGVTATTPDGTSCQITGPVTNVVTGAVARVYSSVVYGSFKVGSGPGNTGSTAYTITVSCTYGSTTDTGTTTFQVLPSITVSPPVSITGRTFTVSGFGFASDALASCNMGSSGGVLTVVTACTISNGAATGSFTLAAAAAVYLITVTSSVAPPATTNLRIVAAPAIYLSPTKTPPGYGLAGTSLRVIVTGGGFATGASPRPCLLVQTPVGPPPPAGLIAGSSCSINADGTVAASFAVSATAVASAAYTIDVTDPPAIATATSPAFEVTVPPAVMSLTAGPGIAGTPLTITQGAVTVPFSTLDAGPCTISGSLVSTTDPSFCLIDNTGLLWLGAALQARFVVSGTVPGGVAYNVIVVGLHGDATAAFGAYTVNPAAKVASPTTGTPPKGYGSPPLGSLPGTTVVVSGTGFLSTDTSCTIVTTAGGLPDIVGASLLCSVTGSTGVLSATFVVQAGAYNKTATPYTLVVTGVGVPGGDTPATPPNFYLDSRIIVNPISGVGGQTISVLGSGFQKPLVPPAACEKFDVWQAGVSVGAVPVAFSVASCSVDVNGFVTASFTVANTLANGFYTIRVVGVGPTPGSPPAATPLGVDAAYATFTKGVPVTLTVTPFSGPTTVGVVTVTAAAGSFGTADRGLPCSITAPSGSNLFAGAPIPTCAISSTGALSASFTVSATAQGGTWTVQVLGAGGGFGSGTFAVTPTMTLVPPSGESFTLISITGSGFSAADAGAGCAATLYSTPLGLPTAVSCSISAVTYQMTGSFVVSGTVAPGSYTVIFPSALGLVSATPAFTKSVSAFNLNPNSGPTGTIVSVTGTGFPPTDATCTITAAPNIIASSTCSITGGAVTGSFTVVGTAVPGVSIVTVTSLASGTAKSAPFLLTPKITLSPASGRANTVVSVSGSNFAVGDIGCAITSSPSGLISSPSCVLVAGTMSGSFTVAVVSSGNYTVFVTGTAGDAGQATFRVPSAPTLTLTPSSGVSGAAVTVTASGSNFAGTTCQLTSSPGGLFLSSSCSLSGGSLTSGSGFTVSSGAAVGTAYTVTVTTNLGALDSATASFIVSAGPLGTLTLAPTSGPIGTPVSGTATGFTTDTSCQLTASPASILSSASCTITGGGNVNVGFVVSSSATPGPYTVLVVGNTGKSAATTTPFTVTATPSFILSANPSSLTLNPGGTSNVDVTVQSFGGFNSPVALVASLPVGVSGGLAPNPVTPPSGGSVHSTFSLVVLSTATSTTAIITLTGTGGGLNTATMITLVILSAATTSTTTSIATATGPYVPPKCVIATATFGSEASPAVQFLRNFRDKLVLSTTAGSAFMQVFNAWYYSFSPSVAQFIANNDPLRAPVRVLLYPLLGVLGVSAFTYSLFSATPEFAIVMAGLVASSLIGLVYLTLPALVGMRALRKRRVIATISIARISMASLATALLLIAVGEFAQSFVLLAIGSSVLVLTCIIAAPVLVTLAILRTNPK